MCTADVACVASCSAPVFNACLEHVFVSKNQVETCCILSKRSANRGPLWYVFEEFFGLENGPVKSNKSQEKTFCLAKISPNPPRHSSRSVSDGVIQLRGPLAGCAGFFCKAPFPVES